MQPRLFYNLLLLNQILILKMENENKMTITKDLQAISKELTKLANQTEKLAVGIGKAEKAKIKPVTVKKKARFGVAPGCDLYEHVVPG